MEFRWNEWNIEHLARHGVSPEEAERVIRNARRPYPVQREEEKWLVWGPNSGGRLLQLIYLVGDDDDAIYVIHGRDLSPTEKRRYRRRRGS
jgi:uncharacterized DUF497 family protein